MTANNDNISWFSKEWFENGRQCYVAGYPIETYTLYENPHLRFSWVLGFIIEESMAMAVHSGTHPFYWS